MASFPPPTPAAGGPALSHGPAERPPRPSGRSNPAALARRREPPPKDGCGPRKRTDCGGTLASALRRVKARFAGIAQAGPAGDWNLTAGRRPAAIGAGPWRAWIPKP